MFRNFFILFLLIATQSVFAANHNTTRSNQAAGLADVTSDQVEEYSYDLRSAEGEGFATGEYLQKMEEISSTVEANKTLATFGLLSNLIERNIEKLDCQRRKDFKECVSNAISLSEAEALKVTMKARKSGDGRIKIDTKERK